MAEVFTQVCLLTEPVHQRTAFDKFSPVSQPHQEVRGRHQRRGPGEGSRGRVGLLRELRHRWLRGQRGHRRPCLQMSGLSKDQDPRFVEAGLNRIFLTPIMRYQR